jgi:hypothetical protein
MEEEPAQPKNNSWRIVCVKRRMIPHPRSHIHIVGIGTGESATWADLRWTLTQALAALKEGDTFYLLDEENEQQMEVVKTKCAVCNKMILSAIKTENTQLQNMRECVYKPDPELSFSDS